MGLSDGVGAVEEAVDEVFLALACDERGHRLDEPPTGQMDGAHLGSDEALLDATLRGLVAAATGPLGGPLVVAEPLVETLLADVDAV